MKKISFAIFIILFALINARKLVSVALIIRHGARTMLFPQFFNITESTYLRQENGRLTKVGKREHYLAGKELFARYQNELLSEYSPHEVTIRASGLNRTVESLFSFMTGFFEPGKGVTLNDEQVTKVTPPIEVEGIKELRELLGKAALPDLQRTVPIHTSVESPDYLYDAASVCPAFGNAVKELQGEIKKVDEEFKDFFEELKKVLPKELSDVKWDSDECYKLNDNIQVVEGNGAKINFTLDSKTKATLENCSIQNSMRKFMGGNIRPKLMAHNLLYNVTTQFEQVMDINSPNKKKLGVFLMSDGHLMAIHRVLGKKLKKNVNYASVLAFELYKNDTEYECEVWYNDDKLEFEEKEAKKFISFVKGKIFDNSTEYMKACLTIKEHEVIDRELYIIISIVAFVVFLAIWGTSWILMLRKQHTKREEMKELLTTDGNSFN